MNTTKQDWLDVLRAALKAAMTKAGVNEDVQIEYCSTDRTWGDRCGLVFFGASDETCERAAKFFETWARKHLRRMGVVGGYNTQESIHFEGRFYFTRYANGAKSWDHVDDNTKLDVEAKTSTTSYGYVSHFEEIKFGYATSYVYYPCAD